MPFEFSTFTAKFHPVSLMYNLAHCPPRHLLLLITAYASIIKYSSGIESTSVNRTGDGR